MRQRGHGVLAVSARTSHVKRLTIIEVPCSLMEMVRRLKSMRTDSKRLLESNSLGHGDAQSTPGSQAVGGVSPQGSRAGRMETFSPLISAADPSPEGVNRKMSQVNTSFNQSENSLNSFRSVQSAQTGKSPGTTPQMAARRGMIRAQSSNWRSTKPR
jgi:hypothetical protein